MAYTAVYFFSALHTILSWYFLVLPFSDLHRMVKVLVPFFSFFGPVRLTVAFPETGAAFIVMLPVSGRIREYFIFDPEKTGVSFCPETVRLFK